MEVVPAMPFNEAEARIKTGRNGTKEKHMNWSGSGTSRHDSTNCLHGLCRRETLDAMSSGAERPFSLLFLEIENFAIFQKLYGEEITGQILGAMERELAMASSEYLGNSKLLVLEQLIPGNFFVLFDSGVQSLDSLPDLAMSLRLSVRSRLNHAAVKLTGQCLEIRAGYAQLCLGNGNSAEGALYGALLNAQQVAKGTLNLKQLRLMDEFRKIVETPLLGIVYQPIVDLTSGTALGWEALARGPKQSYFHSPATLFDFAEEVGSIFDLEKACREQAIRQLGNISREQKLFLNIHPRTLVDPSFSAGETRRILGRYGLEPYNVVFEITERHSIRDFTLFHRTLDHYRQQGYLVAIDDVGSGYSGLWAIAEVRPDFIKIDMSLIRGIDSNPVKQALMETFIGFTEKIDCGLITEGIETEAEMKCLISIGARYGQGYYLAKPDFPKPLPAWGNVESGQQS